MAYNETWLQQDLNKSVKVRYLGGNLFSQDVQGNLIGVELTRNGEGYTDGGSVAANVIRADGATVAVAGSISGSKAQIILPAAAYAIEGAVTIIIKLTEGGQTTTIAAIISMVYQTTTSITVDPGTVIPSIQALIDQIETAVAGIPADYSELWTSLAPAYSSSAKYAAGQYCTNGGKVYRCTTPITAGETWTASHWTAVNLGGEISDIKSAIANVVESAAPYIISNVTDFVTDDWELGGINATGGEFDATYIIRTKYFYPYNPNCTYTWAGRTSDATVRWTFFYDSDFNFIARNNSIVLPFRTDASYLRFAYGYASNSGVTIDSTIKATLVAAFGFDVTPSNDIIAKGRNNLRIDDDLLVFNHSAIVFETAKTYLNVAFDPNDRLAYSEGIGLFQPNIRNENNLKCISCSQFVQAILSGISYDFSRYVLSVNEPAEWGFLSGYYGETMTDYGDYLTANEMGLFFDSRNQLRELNPASPQAKVGDLLLFNDGENFYHCAICTGITTERVYFMHASDKGSMFPEGLPRIVDGEQAGVFIRYLPWSSRYAPTHFVSINDIITDSIPVSIKRIVHDTEAKAGSYSSASTFIKSITKDFDAGLYTIKIEDTGSGDSRYYVRLNYYKENGSVPATSEEAKYSESIEFIQKQNTFKAIFYAQLPIRRIDIRCVDGSTYSFKSMQMFDNAVNY